MLLLGVFADFASNPSGLTGSLGHHINGLVFGRAGLLGHQVIAVVAVVGFCMVVTYLLGMLIKVTIGLRRFRGRRSPPGPERRIRHVGLRVMDRNSFPDDDR